MLPVLNFLGLAIPVPAFTLLIGVWAGLSLAEKHAQRHKLSAEDLYNLAFNALIAGIIGARLIFPLRNVNAFLANPGSLISLNFGLFDPFGGLVVGLLAAFIYGQRKNMPFWPTLDALTPAFAIFMLAFPLANLASGNAFGAETSQPWAIELWGAMRHPVQVYEALGAGLILWYLWPTRQSHETLPGLTFVQFAGLSALARLFFEAFRGNSLVVFSGLRAAQVAAWLVLAAALWGYAKLNQPQNPVQ
jgi:phosphatidylglycerol:prolipoprotein diacylglycerol transferase